MSNTALKIEETPMPFQLRGSSFTIIVLKVLDPDNPSFFPQLSIKTRQAPTFFHNAAVVLDMDDVEADMGVPELASFAARMKQCQLIPIGIQGGTPSLQKAALAIGLAVMPSGRPAKAETPNKDKASSTVPQPSAMPATGSGKTIVITEPVRSGQQIYAPGGDLVVMAAVSAGAELLADGHIHVYGPMRGRALAGLGGDTNARIFCQSLEAELVSVAGLYRISEDIEKNYWKKNVQIYLDDGYLRIQQLS